MPCQEIYILKITPPEQTCSDGIENQDETDVDCGGIICQTCIEGDYCLIDGDCSSDNCVGGVCEALQNPCDSPCPTGTDNGDCTCTIILQDADTENLEDGLIYTVQSSNEFGSATYLAVGVDLSDNNPILESYLKFNISGISGNILDATLNLLVDAETLESGETINIGVSHVYSYPSFNINNGRWEEGEGDEGGWRLCNGAELCWNSRAINDELNHTLESFNLFDDSPSGWYSWDVKEMLQTSLNLNDDEITIRLNAYNGNTGSSDYITFHSKEHTTQSQKPKLEITYSKT